MTFQRELYSWDTGIPVFYKTIAVLEENNNVNQPHLKSNTTAAIPIA